MARLTKNELNSVVNSMIYQHLKGFDIHAVCECDLSDEQQNKIISLIHEKAERYNNNYTHIGSTVDLVNNIVEKRVNERRIKKTN